MSTKKTLAILVGGGPAPGINAVLAAATIEARNHGLRVLGCYDGFKWLVQGDTQHVVDLEINDTSRIHFDGGSIIRTSRTNPSKSAEAIRQVREALQRLGVNHLLTRRRSPRPPARPKTSGGAARAAAPAWRLATRDWARSTPRPPSATSRAPPRATCG